MNDRRCNSKRRSERDALAKGNIEASGAGFQPMPRGVSSGSGSTTLSILTQSTLSVDDYELLNENDITDASAGSLSKEVISSKL